MSQLVVHICTEVLVCYHLDICEAGVFSEAGAPESNNIMVRIALFKEIVRFTPRKNNAKCDLYEKWLSITSHCTHRRKILLLKVGGLIAHHLVSQ